MTYRLEPATLIWTEENQPQSAQFGDIYFSQENGLAETQHVFLVGNRLQERWGNLTHHQSSTTFTIGETGFGTGLNFLAAWQLWQKTAPDSAKLHFISSELHPLQRQDLQRALALWPELNSFSELLLEHYPPLVPGFHRLHLSPQVTLDLLFGDSLEMFDALCPTTHPDFAGVQGWKIDAWFLDGFAPAKNPLMWQEALFERMALLSTIADKAPSSKFAESNSDSTTLATFTSAGAVKRGLQRAGFTLQKVPGFGRKREMLCGEMVSKGSSRTPNETALEKNIYRTTQDHATWHLHRPHSQESSRRAVVIGAGIAGASIAQALAVRGWQVEVVEQNPQIAQGASGNPQAALYTKLSVRAGLLADYGLLALTFAQRFYRPFWHSEAGNPCGLAQCIAQTSVADALEHRFQNAADLIQRMDQACLSEKAGVALSSGGLWFPGSGWLRPKAIISALLDHPNIQLKCDISVNRIERESTNWALFGQSDALMAKSPVLICAAGLTNRQWFDQDILPIRPIRGQISQLPIQPQTRGLKAVLCGEGYVIPAEHNTHCIGATYGLDETEIDLRAEDHLANLRTVKDLFEPALEVSPNADWSGRASVRVSTPDYLPIVGAVPHREAFLQRFKRLSKDATFCVPELCPVESGLYLFTGLGSRGFCYAPLAAEHLASQINGECSPLPRSLQQAIHPARFLLRGLRRGKLRS